MSVNDVAAVIFGVAFFVFLGLGAVRLAFDAAPSRTISSLLWVMLAVAMLRAVAVQTLGGETDKMAIFVWGAALAFAVIALVSAWLNAKRAGFRRP